MKIPNRRDLQQIAINHSSNVDFKDFPRFYKKCTRKDEKLQYNIIRAVAKIPTLSSGKLDKYEYLTSIQYLNVSKKFYARNNIRYQKGQNLFIHDLARHLKNKEKQLKTR